MPRDAGKKRERPEEDIAMLEQIQEANPVAGVQYLEYLVLQRRSTVSSIHSNPGTFILIRVYSRLVSRAASKTSISMRGSSAFLPRRRFCI